MDLGEHSVVVTSGIPSRRPAAGCRWKKTRLYSKKGDPDEVRRSNEIRDLTFRKAPNLNRSAYLAALDQVDDAEQDDGANHRDDETG